MPKILLLYLHPNGEDGYAGPSGEAADDAGEGGDCVTLGDFPFLNGLWNAEKGEKIDFYFINLIINV